MRSVLGSILFEPEGLVHLASFPYKWIRLPAGFPHHHPDGMATYPLSVAFGVFFQHEQPEAALYTIIVATMPR
jgi:hypothetical protein